MLVARQSIKLGHDGRTSYIPQLWQYAPVLPDEATDARRRPTGRSRMSTGHRRKPPEYSHLTP